MLHRELGLGAIGAHAGGVRRRNRCDGFALENMLAQFDIHRGYSPSERSAHFRRQGLVDLHPRWKRIRQTRRRNLGGLNARLEECPLRRIRSQRHGVASIDGQARWQGLLGRRFAGEASGGADCHEGHRRADHEAREFLPREAIRAGGMDLFVGVVFVVIIHSRVSATAHVVPSRVATKTAPR